MPYGVSTGDLDGVASAFTNASSDVERLRMTLASGAGAPESSSVIGSGAAAGEYARAFGQWLHNLDQLSSSLETMAHKVSAAAAAYAQTESANTVQHSP